jgi:DNA-binding transcriptional regulator LsrR (DeoR family)
LQLFQDRYNADTEKTGHNDAKLRMSNLDNFGNKLDNAAKAAWLYFIAGNTQDEIAVLLKISRPTVQRLIALARSYNLITFRLHHPIAECMELKAALRQKFDLAFCDVVPNDPKEPNSIQGVAEACAAYIEEKLASPEPIVMALGSGRTLRAAVQQVGAMECARHTLISLVSIVASDGSASAFDALARLADLTKATAYPMFMPVLAESPEERELLVNNQLVKRLHGLAEKADTTIVGVGQMDAQAQQFLDGFISREQLEELKHAGAVGEIVGWAFDVSGHILDTATNARITSAPRRPDLGRLVVGVAVGQAKVGAIYSAFLGRLLTGLITDVATASALLKLG